MELALATLAAVVALAASFRGGEVGGFLGVLLGGELGECRGLRAVEFMSWIFFCSRIWVGFTPLGRHLWVSYRGEVLESCVADDQTLGLACFVLRCRRLEA